MRGLSGISVMAVVTAALALPAGASADRGFRFGVAAGDVTSDSARIWGRTAGTGPVRAKVARDREFDRLVDRERLGSRNRNNQTVQKTVGKLPEGERFFYRFCMPGERSEARSAALRRTRCSKIGRFETAPKPSRHQTIEFSYTGDYDAQPEPGEDKPFWNNFNIFREITQEKNDFNIALGDTIYSDSEVPGIDKVATSVKEKWGKYRMNLAQRELSDARGSAGFYSHWDDHEFLNDFFKSRDKFSTSQGKIKIDGDELYERGVQAFRDYAPVSFSSRDGLYRTFRWGKDLELFFLDERSFRDANADEGGTCDNAQSGEPDFAPTAPQSTRNLFSAVLPELAEPVPEKCKRRIADPDRSFLGERQFKQFRRDVTRSDATFKVIMNETPIQQFYVNPYDRWEGFEAERQRMLRLLSQRVDNAIFLTEDWHAALVNDARFKTLEPGGPVNSGLLEVVASPVATANVNIEFERETGVDNIGTLADQLFFEPPPPAGVGMQCSQVDAFAYGHVEVTRDTLTVEPRDFNGEPLKQEDGTPCGPFTLTRE